MLLARHADATTIICINDPYDCTESIKGDERESRIQGRGYIPNVYMKSTDLGICQTCLFLVIMTCIN